MSQSHGHAALGRSIGTSAAAAASGAPDSGAANGHRVDAAMSAAQRGGQGSGGLAMTAAASGAASAAGPASAVAAGRAETEGSELRMGAECGNVIITLQCVAQCAAPSPQPRSRSAAPRRRAAPPRSERRNIVATVNVTVGQKRALDLKKLSHHARFAEYSPKVRGPYRGAHGPQARLLTCVAARRNSPPSSCGCGTRRRRR